MPPWLHIRPSSVWRNRALWTLLLCVFIVSVGFGIVVPVLPFYVRQIGITPSQIGLLLSSYALTQVITAPLWGILTDRIGSRKVISLGTAGLAISLVVFGLTSTLWVLFASRMFGGAMGAGAVPASMTSAGNASLPEQRGAAMGMMGAGMGAGFILGPALGGYLSSWGLAIPFFMAAVTAMIASVLAAILLPGNTPTQAAPDHSVPSITAKSSILSNRHRWFTPGKLVLGFFLFAALMASFGDGNRQSTLALYSIDLFGLRADEVGLTLTLMGLTYVVAQVAIVGPAVDWIGETAVLFAGLVLNVIGFGLFLVALEFWTLTATICLQGAGMACIQTSIPSMISKKAGAHQGTFMGLRTGLENASRVAGPIWGGRVYELSPAYPFWTGTLTYAVCILIGALIYIVRAFIRRSQLSLSPETNNLVY